MVGQVSQASGEPRIDSTSASSSGASDTQDWPPKAIDLFCGAGGLSLGLIEAGFNIICAIDNKPQAVETQRANFHHPVRCEDIEEDVELPMATVIVGGPPCQGFSSAGAKRRGDKRNTLVSVFAEIVARYKPLAFVFENVEGFLTAEYGIRVLDLLEPLIGAGYRIHLRKINAANFAVPQHRKRIIAVGGLGWDPRFPEPVTRAFGAPGAYLAGRNLPLAPTLTDALSGLPNPSNKAPGEPLGHFSQSINGLDRERIRLLLPGQTMRDLPQGLWHHSYRRRAYRRVIDGTPTEHRGGAPAGIRRLLPDTPSKTITSAAPDELIHPFEDRFLTLRECARLQTFPDTFVFAGTPSQQARLIGDAVPPRLAAFIARSLIADLQTAQPKHKGGALLTFVPTLSNGMSPALWHTIELVSSRFYAKADLAEQLALWH